MAILPRICLIFNNLNQLWREKGTGVIFSSTWTANKTGIRGGNKSGRGGD